MASDTDSESDGAASMDEAEDNLGMILICMQHNNDDNNNDKKKKRKKKDNNK